jgi:hypothetical protein
LYLFVVAARPLAGGSSFYLCSAAASISAVSISVTGAYAMSPWQQLLSPWQQLLSP